MKLSELLELWTLDSRIDASHLLTSRPAAVTIPSMQRSRIYIQALLPLFSEIPYNEASFAFYRHIRKVLPRPILTRISRSIDQDSTKYVRLPVDRVQNHIARAIERACVATILDIY